MGYFRTVDKPLAVAGAGHRYLDEDQLISMDQRPICRTNAHTQLELLGVTKFTNRRYVILVTLCSAT